MPNSRCSVGVCESLTAKNGATSTSVKTPAAASSSYLNLRPTGRGVLGFFSSPSRFLPCSCPGAVGLGGPTCNDQGALRLKQHSQKVRTEPLRPWEDAPAAQGP